MKKTLARHKWLVNCTIKEMIDTTTEQRYFVATVCGWNGFYIPYLPTDEVISEVKEIREKIEADDKEVFENPKYFKETVFEALAEKNEC